MPAAPNVPDIGPDDLWHPQDYSGRNAPTKEGEEIPIPEEIAQFIDSISHGYGGDCYIISACEKLYRKMQERKVKVPLEENLEAIIGTLWEEDNRTIGGQGINPHAYRIGCRAMYKLTANEHPAVMYWFHKFMTAAGAQGGVTKTASNETTPQK